MKKTIITVVLFFVLFFGGSLTSYFIAKRNANIIALKYKENLSPLKGNLVLFIDSRFKPCWVFRAEHKEILTGATYDVYISLLGEVMETP